MIDAWFVQDFLDFSERQVVSEQAEASGASPTKNKGSVQFKSERVNSQLVRPQTHDHLPSLKDYHAQQAYALLGSLLHVFPQ